eukprot:scaffold108304_cov52-Attheya_sp.AAC.2
MGLLGESSAHVPNIFFGKSSEGIPGIHASRYLSLNVGQRLFDGTSPQGRLFQSFTLPTLVQLVPRLKGQQDQYRPQIRRQGWRGRKQ